MAAIALEVSDASKSAARLREEVAANYFCLNARSLTHTHARTHTHTHTHTHTRTHTHTHTHTHAHTRTHTRTHAHTHTNPPHPTHAPRCRTAQRADDDAAEAGIA